MEKTEKGNTDMLVGTHADSAWSSDGRKNIDLIQLIEWKNFYREVFDNEAALSLIPIPPYRNDFSDMLVIPMGITLDRVLQQCRVRFDTYCPWYKLERSITTHDRTLANGSYAVRLRRRAAADEEFSCLSSLDIRQSGTKVITLLERLVMELKYVRDTGLHLDDQGTVTLCAGSRTDFGDVPGVRWFNNALRIISLTPREAKPNIRIREVLTV